MNWEMVAAIAAVVSFLVSVFALYVAHSSSKTTNKIASEALKTARHANDISLGLAREPAIVEFSFSDSARFEFDFTDANGLVEELDKTVTIQNVGNRPVDALAIELIGISGLTHLVSDVTAQVAKLPSYSARLDLKSALQPNSLAHIDVRHYLLAYLTRLTQNLPEGAGPYTTVVNMVLAPKAINEPTPVSAGIDVTKNDRRLLAVTFTPAILLSPQAKAVLETTEIPHRVY